jgi:hypothetical protein
MKGKKDTFTRYVGFFLISKPSEFSINGTTEQKHGD